MANDITLKSKSGVSKYPKTYSRNILDKDTTPTEDSTNVITSGGVYDALDGKLDVSNIQSTGSSVISLGTSTPEFGVIVSGAGSSAPYAEINVYKDNITLAYKEEAGLSIDENGINVLGTVSGTNNLLTTSSIASASTLGGIKVGTGFNVDSSTGAGKVEGVEYKNASGVAQANALKFVKCTQAEYTALGTYDNDTFYIIVG